MKSNVPALNKFNYDSAGCLFYFIFWAGKKMIKALQFLNLKLTHCFVKLIIHDTYEEYKKESYRSPFGHLFMGVWVH